MALPSHCVELNDVVIGCEAKAGADIKNNPDRSEVIRDIVVKFVLSKVRIIMELSDKINSLIKNNDLEGAIVELNQMISADSDDADAYFERGKLYWRLGRKREAISDYNRAVSLDSSSPAAEALRQSMEIMSFYNRDLYNP